MALGLTEFLVALDLILVASACWFLRFRRWRGVCASAAALLGSLPLLRFAMAGQFRLDALFIFLAMLLAAFVLLFSPGHRD